MTRIPTAERARRALAAVPAVAVLAVILVGTGAASPALACACGGIAAPIGSSVAVNEERAIVSWDTAPAVTASGSGSGTERIDLLLDVLADSDQTGLIFPTPSPATVSAGDRDDFDALEAAIQPTEVIDYDWWGGDSGEGASAGAAPDVLAVVQLGPVEATTLKASDAEGLTTWLTDNGYGLSDAVTALLPDYIERGWSFVALKLTSDAALDGALDPIRFTFNSDALVYPMDMSRAATDEQRVRLYVFGDHRVGAAAIDDPANLISQSATIWAGKAPAAFTDRGSYLSVLELDFAVPKVDVPGDLTLVQTGDDEPLTPEYRVTRPLLVLGVPFGWLIVVAAAAGAVVLAALGTLVVRAVRSASS